MIPGTRFGRWTVLSESARGKVLCRCECGTEREVLVTNLQRGGSNSCGCARRETSSQRMRVFNQDHNRSPVMREHKRRITAARNLTHGSSKRGAETPTYRTWKAMWARCTNPNVPHWKDYGGRGITICERWRSFENFLADMGDRPEGRSIDRIDVNGNYEPSNCRWATALEQRHNRRDTGSLA